MNSAGLVLMILMFIVVESGRNRAMADYRLNMTDIANPTLSTQHKPEKPQREVYNANNTIDGNDETDMVKCLCCAHTREDDKKPTLIIILDRPYPIKKIVAYGRTDNTYNPFERLLKSDVKVYLDNQSVNQSYNSSTNQVTVSRDDAILAKNITITRTVPDDQTWYLIVCELVVTVLECEDGQFLLGAECVSCHCTNNYCNSSTGVCPTGGCKNGWIGVSCNQTCSNGKYGKQCAYDCAGHCKDNATCNHTNGICSDGCEAGYEGNTCSTSCSAGNYGYECNNTCGHCKDNTTCNVVNGNCSTGCIAGYMGDNCKQNCTNNTFGENCVHRCHCEGDQQCHTVTGECPGGQCSIEFGGRNCSIDLNILTNFKDKNSTSMSKPYANWTSDKVIDGIIPTGNKTPDTCLCCAATLENESWWMLNLSMLYPVKAIRFYGRNDEQNHHQFGGFSLYASNSSDMSEKPIYTNNMSEPGHVFDIHINDTLLQYINIRKKTSLTICEIKVIKGDCPKGTFGDECSKACHCADGKACDDFDNGKCETPTCKPGWQGQACDKEITKEKEEPTTGLIAGMIGAICLCVVLIVVTVCYLRNGFGFASKCKKPKENKPVALNDLTNKTDVPNRVPKEKNAADGTVAVEINGVDNTYYSFLPRKEDIKVYQLWDYIQQHMKNGCGPFYSEYKVLEKGLKYDHDIALKPENKPKNRYNDMVTYNQSRVKLIPTSSEESDYINASFIDGFEKSAKFIATQGPTTATLADFWRMMWQQKSGKIVMLTRLIEEGKNKCYLYWPEDGKKTFGNITVKALKTDTSTDYVTRHFTMHKGKEAPRSVIQYHFKTWPDKGVPDSAWCLVNFWRVVNQSPSSTDSGPIVVHCSAGIGRTGTYIALDNLYNQAIAEGSIRPLQMVETLRRQRVNMVQTQKQYVYLHEAVAEALLFGTHFIWSSQFKCMYDYMLETEPGSALSRLEVQYNLINASLVDIGTTTEVESEYSNVTTEVSERYSYRPHRTTTNSEYAAELGAMLLPDFSNQDSFLVANSPSEASLHQFWCLVVEQNVKTIISMTSTSAANYKTSFSLGASTCYEDEMFNVTSSEEKSSNFCTERTFSISRKKKTQTGTVSPIKQFHYPLWADDSYVPDNTQSMLTFIEKVNKWRSSTSETGLILIHCGDEDKRSGIVCVLMNEINRLQQDGGRINIIQSMKTMKQRNRDIIPNFEQYKYCHDAVMASIKSYETESKDNNENSDIYQNI